MKTLSKVSGAAFIGLATAFASADVITANFAPDKDTYNLTLAFAYDSSSLFGAGSLSLNYVPVHIKGSDHVTGGTTAALSIFFENDFALPVVAYTFFGRYVDGATEGATVAFDLATAASLVSSSSPWPFDASLPMVTEADFLIALTTFNADVLDKVFRKQIAGGMVAAPGTDSALVNFSGATDGGDVTAVHVVPSPAALSMLGLALASPRRRRAA